MQKNTNTICAPQNILQPEAVKTPPVNQAEKDIDQAVERIYRIYGPDLSVFFRAVRGQLQLERSERADNGENVSVDDEAF